MLLNATQIDIEDLVFLFDGRVGAKTGLTPLERLFLTDKTKSLKLTLENGNEVEMIQLVTMPFGQERYCMLLAVCKVDGEVQNFPVCYKLNIGQKRLSLEYVRDENSKKMQDYYYGTQNIS